MQAAIEKEAIDAAYLGSRRDASGRARAASGQGRAKKRGDFPLKSPRLRGKGT